ncbi:MAG: T9SS type A sorting domain-containing protein [Bacteroidetes bacterium]|jgi:hypothetical protein|nr:T9SS type A sorting domain-containing protein [Bacteroidota bacterium]
MKKTINYYIMVLSLFVIPFTLLAQQNAFDSPCTTNNEDNTAEHSYCFTTGSNEMVTLIWDVIPLTEKGDVLGCNVFKRSTTNEAPIQINEALITSLNEHYSFTDQTTSDPASAPYYDIQVITSSDTLMLTQIQANWLLDFKAGSTESLEMLVRPWQMPSGKNLMHIKVFVDGSFVGDVNWEFDEPLLLPLEPYYPGICYEFIPVYSEGTGPSFEVCDAFIRYQLSLFKPYPVAGASWHYDYLNFYVSGYIHIWHTGDTLIQGMPAGIVKKEGHYYNQDLLSYYQQDLGKEYFSSDGDRVYVYRHEQFYTLWDFSAAVGDSWIIPGSNDMYCDSTALVTVEETGDTLINGQMLRWFVLDYFGDENGQWNYYGKIIERFGPADDYLLPSPTCMADAFEGGPLRCYEDDDFGLFETGIAQSCDYLVSVGEQQADAGFAMHPNPATDEVFIRIEIAQPAKVIVTVYGMDGRLLMQSKETSRNGAHTVTLNTSKLRLGSYEVVVQTETGFSQKRLVIVR